MTITRFAAVVLVSYWQGWRVGRFQKNAFVLEGGALQLQLHSCVLNMKAITIESLIEDETINVVQSERSD